MPSVNKIKLNICATDYVLTTDESDSYMRELAGEGGSRYAGAAGQRSPHLPPSMRR